MRATVLCLPLCGMLVASGFADAAERPNILWLSAEDISAVTLGCYGGPAKTPRIDALAADGLRFDAAFSAAPVCAPSRSAIITGMMPTSLGSLAMRCKATPPPFVVGFPTFLRDAGYYCINNSKTDYNFGDGFKPGWDESSEKAHWRNRPNKQQPFFAVFNLFVTHESILFSKSKLEKRLQPLPASERTDPASVDVFPFYPDTPVVRQTLAHRLDLAAVLDRDVAGLLDELEADGLADSTIVVFWGDHGEGIPRGKRALNDYGFRVPLIVHVPERFRARAMLPDGGEPTGETNNLVNLMDLGPTTLDIAGVAIPDWMEGTSFLGSHATSHETVIGVADRMSAVPDFGRSVRDARFRYIRNFLPWRDGDDLTDYAIGVPITGELRAARAAGTLPKGAEWFARTIRPAEELYDVTTDPHNIVTLAVDPAHDADRARLREVLRSWMLESRDTGILPEPILRREALSAGSEWAIFHSAVDRDTKSADRYEAILAACWDVASQPADAPWNDRLASSDPAVRFWAVHGFAWSAARNGSDSAAPAIATLQPFLEDSDPVVRIVAAWWLVKLGVEDPTHAFDVLRREMTFGDREIRHQALAAIDELGESGRPLWNEAVALDLGNDEEYSRHVVTRIHTWLKASKAP